MKKTLIFSLLVLLFISCSKKGDENTNKLPPEFRALHNIFDGQGIGAATNIADDILLLFSSNGQEYAWFENNEILKTESVDKEDGLFDGLLIESVGASIDYEEERLIFFNKLGSIYQWANIDPDLVIGAANNDTLIQFSESVYGLDEWGIDDSCPFDDISAIFGFSKFAEGCQIAEDDDLYLWMANDDGSAVVRYQKEKVEFDDEVELELWRATNVCGGSPTVFPLQSLGAACVFENDNVSYELYFSKNGKQLTLLNNSTGMFSEIFNL